LPTRPSRIDVAFVATFSALVARSAATPSIRPAISAAAPTSGESRTTSGTEGDAGDLAVAGSVDALAEAGDG
jgi:hypothetical protein